MSQPTRVTISHEHVNLLSVRGRLDWGGLQDLQKQIDLLLDRGARFVVADLSGATRSDHRLTELLADTAELLRHRDGWLRLIGDDGLLPALEVDGAAVGPDVPPSGL